ncbi:MobV family relaxase, partial [Staphylococcus ureilyticus]
LDIDLEKSHLNYDLVNNEPIDFNAMIDEKIEENYTGKRKIRSDAVKHVDGIITSDNEFFEFKTQAQIQAFFEDSKLFLEDEYGKDNLLYATVHMDEKTPHMHYGVVPITEDGRLSAKEVVGNKKALTEFQDRFNQYLNDKGHNLERGESKHKTERKHKQVEKYKSETQYHEKERDKTRALAKGTERQVRDKHQLLMHYEKELQPMKEQYDKMKNEVDDWEQIKMPKLKQKAKELNNQNAQESRKIEDLKQKQDELLNTFGNIDIQIDKYKEQREREKALRDQIRADKEKEEEQYQNLVKVLEKPVSDEYEHEYKRPSIFSRDKEPTGNVIISEDDYKTLKQRSALAARFGA